MSNQSLERDNLRITRSRYGIICYCCYKTMHVLIGYIVTITGAPVAVSQTQMSHFRLLRIIMTDNMLN